VNARGQFAYAAHCDAEASTVLALLDDVDGWTRWARPLIAQARWDGWGAGGVGGPGAVRRIGAWPMWIRELILTRGPCGHTYTVVSPTLFTRYLGSVDVRGCPSGGVEVEWRVEFIARHSVLTPLLEAVLTRTIAGLLTRLTATAEQSNQEWSTAWLT
jgi:hypothetical protein